MTAEQADEAALRYASGEGLLELASDYDVNTATVRHHIIKRGVAMRPRGPRAWHT